VLSLFAGWGHIVGGVWGRHAPLLTL